MLRRGFIGMIGAGVACAAAKAVEVLGVAPRVERLAKKVDHLPQGCVRTTWTELPVVGGPGGWGKAESGKASMIVRYDLLERK